MEFLHVYFNLMKRIVFTSFGYEDHFPEKRQFINHNHHYAFAEYHCVDCDFHLFNVMIQESYCSIDLQPGSLDHKCTVDEFLENCKKSFVKNNPKSSGEEYVDAFKDKLVKDFGNNIERLRLHLYLNDQKTIFIKPISEVMVRFVKVIIRRHIFDSRLSKEKMVTKITNDVTDVLLYMMKLDDLSMRLNDAIGWKIDDEIKLNQLKDKYQDSVKKNLRLQASKEMIHLF